LQSIASTRQLLLRGIDTPDGDADRPTSKKRVTICEWEESHWTPKLSNHRIGFEAAKRVGTGIYISSYRIGVYWRLKTLVTPRR
jgi:hypothetical protein